MSKVIVLLKDDDDGHVYEGDYDAQLTPNNALLIVENVVQSGEGFEKEEVTTPVVRSIYNAHRWDQVGVS